MNLKILLIFTLALNVFSHASALSPDGSLEEIKNAAVIACTEIKQESQGWVVEVLKINGKRELKLSENGQVIIHAKSVSSKVIPNMEEGPDDVEFLSRKWDIGLTFNSESMEGKAFYQQNKKWITKWVSCRIQR